MSGRSFTDVRGSRPQKPENALWVGLDEASQGLVGERSVSKIESSVMDGIIAIRFLEAEHGGEIEEGLESTVDLYDGEGMHMESKIQCGSKAPPPSRITFLD